MISYPNEDVTNWLWVSLKSSVDDMMPVPQQEFLFEWFAMRHFGRPHLNMTNVESIGDPVSIAPEDVRYLDHCRWRDNLNGEKREKSVSMFIEESESRERAGRGQDEVSSTALSVHSPSAAVEKEWRRKETAWMQKKQAGLSWLVTFRFF